MRKLICLIMVLCLTFAGCGTGTLPPETTEPTVGDPELRSPPDLTIRCENDSFTISSGNYSWTALGANGEMCSVVACGSHPLDGRFSQEFRYVTGDSVQLLLPVEPDSLAILRWPSDHMDETDFAGDIILAENLNITLEKGSWVYQITASWDRDTWSGSAEYHLYVTK